MRVLHITPEAPGRRSGGTIVVKQTLMSLFGNGCDVDYVGPEIIDEEIRAHYHTVYELQPSHNLLLRVYDTLFMNTNQRYRSWLKLNLDYTQYQAIVMDFTKLNYVLDRVPHKKLIVRVHNVEADYSYNNLLHKKNLVNILEAKFAGKRERQIVNAAKLLIALTEKDKERLCSLYQISEEKITIVPVCLESPSPITGSDEEKKELCMILNGSLWFGPNYEGIKWFLDHVYSKLNFPKHLIIAGSRPNQELIDYTRTIDSITLVDTPPDMTSYLKMADLSVAPVFDGAGMKVKVAEALSFGLPVAGTSHAFEGYDIEDGVNSFRADTAKEFIDKITKYSSLDSDQRLEIKKNSYELYRRKYSQECSTQLFHDIFQGELGL